MESTIKIKTAMKTIKRSTCDCITQVSNGCLHTGALKFSRLHIAALILIVNPMFCISI